LPEGGEVDGLARLEALDVRIARPVKGDPAARGEVAEEVPANDAGRLARERVDVQKTPAAVRVDELEKTNRRQPARRGLPCTRAARSSSREARARILNAADRPRPT
jgi:hypothetical protein